MAPLRSAAALALALVCLAPRPAPAQPARPAVELRYRFQPGGVSAYRLSAEQKLEVGTSLTAGETQKFSNRLTVDTRQTVLSAGPEGAVVEYGFGAPRATATLQGLEVPVAGLDDLPRLKFNLRVSERGQVSAVEALVAPELSPEVQRLAAELKKNFIQNAIVFPERALAPGESWTEERSLPSGLPGTEGLSLALKATYTLRGLEKVQGRACARIDSQVLMGIKGRLVKNGLPVEADLQGRGQGQACFSLEEGRMLRTQASLGMAGTLEASQAGQSAVTTLKLEASLTQELR
ncbi:MAG TPA: hypothetical protein PK668_19965 [Myxococcota bacterium]|nr:hypothetical protein [Myxococcota bacterium]HRY94988.1 hypothetical protein [Myxococcota bacterium]HSA23329.1 hypothetical protein [Myxococcota bacterium]